MINTLHNKINIFMNKDKTTPFEEEDIELL